jgi:hypothetical protein
VISTGLPMGARGLLKETLGVIGRLSLAFSPPHPAMIVKDDATAVTERSRETSLE